MDEAVEGSGLEGQNGFPSELRGPVPRKVRLSSANAPAMVGAVALCLGIGGMGLVTDCYSDLQKMNQRTILRQQGRDAAGTVSATHAGHGSHTVSYTFRVNERYYSGKAELPKYRSILHESVPIAVRYLPNDPSVNHPADWEWSGIILMDMIEQAFMLFFILGGIILLRALFRDRKLARVGKPTEGVVIDCDPGKTEFQIEYEFRLDDGTQIRGSTSAPDEYGVGEWIWVLYLPQKPHRNSLYPLRYIEVAE